MAPPRIFVTLASIIATASASYPELIPGEGLPSFEELGLTSEQLFTAPHLALAPRDDQYTQHTRCCGPGEGADYTANVDNRVLCNIGDARITGLNKNSHPLDFDVPLVFASVKCWDAALGLQWTFTNCNEGGEVMGYWEVGGGDYVVAALRSSTVFAVTVDNSPVELWK
ncbi:hypothetical protein V500_10765 [Pseudogymnoascus sp. VKM F-4518 (FW-2643)]|nr:hypothetical protein V500_10765 [Pseudogymnoascus sp. VKM F-4518 (FW-2643)]